MKNKQKNVEQAKECGKCMMNTICSLHDKQSKKITGKCPEKVMY